MNDRKFTSFENYRRIATGNLSDVLSATKGFIDSRSSDAATGSRVHVEGLLIFSHESGRQVDFDFRGALDDVLSRAIPESGDADSGSAAKPGKGRPRLGVTSGEVTLLPRHWEWLSSQSRRASGTIRRLVDEAIAREKTDPKKQSEILGTLLWSLAGNLEGFEEATRCLYRQDLTGLFAYTDAWPGDLPGFVREWFGETAGTRRP